MKTKLLKTIILFIVGVFLISSITLIMSCKKEPPSSTASETAVQSSSSTSKESTSNDTNDIKEVASNGEAAVMGQFDELLADGARPYGVISFINENIGKVQSANADLMLEKLEYIQKNYVKYYTDLLFEDDWQGKLNTIFHRDININDIDEIQDEGLKKIIAEIFNGGFKLIALEGSFYPYIDFELLNKYFDSITPKYQDYVNIMALESKKIYSRDAALTISWDELAFRLINCEEYLIRYPDENIRKKAVGDFYMKYLVSYIIGQNNTPSYSYENNQIKQEVLDSYDKLISDYPDHITSNFIKTYQEMLADKNNNIDDEIFKKIDDIYRQAIHSFNLDAPQLLLEGIKNTYYQTNLIENYSIVLFNGKYIEINKSDSEKNIIIQLSDFTSFGDFDGDGINDAAAILMSENQDNVMTYSLTLNLNRYFYFKNIQDKIIGNSKELEIIGISIEEDKINLKVNQDNKDKSMIFGIRDDQLFEYQ